MGGILFSITLCGLATIVMLCAVLLGTLIVEVAWPWAVERLPVWQIEWVIMPLLLAVLICSAGLLGSWASAIDELNAVQPAQDVLQVWEVVRSLPIVPPTPLFLR